MPASISLSAASDHASPAVGDTGLSHLSAEHDTKEYSCEGCAQKTATIADLRKELTDHTYKALDQLQGSLAQVRAEHFEMSRTHLQLALELLASNPRSAIRKTTSSKNPFTRFGRSSALAREVDQMRSVATQLDTPQGVKVIMTSGHNVLGHQIVVVYPFCDGTSCCSDDSCIREREGAANEDGRGSLDLSQCPTM